MSIHDVDTEVDAGGFVVVVTVVVLVAIVHAIGYLSLLLSLSSLLLFLPSNEHWPTMHKLKSCILK